MGISFQCEKYRAFGSKNLNEVPIVKIYNNSKSIKSIDF
jgi:hypothetical protein